MFGVIPASGHNGGMTATTLKRVHMGFAPYGIYQVIDDYQAYSSNSAVAGLNGSFEMVRFEQTGEATIKLLPKSVSLRLNITGFGMSWSYTDYTDEPSRWQYALPDDLRSANENKNMQ